MRKFWTHPPKNLDIGCPICPLFNLCDLKNNDNDRGLSAKAKKGRKMNSTSILVLQRIMTQIEGEGCVRLFLPNYM